MSDTASLRYRFGGSGRPGVLLGLGWRQSAPLVAGCVWLTLGLMAGYPLVGMIGPVTGAVMSFGRWRGVPVFDIAMPGVRLGVLRRTKRDTWVRHPLLATTTKALPKVLDGLDLFDVAGEWDGAPVSVGVVRDRPAACVSVVMAVSATGFAVSSPTEQDSLIAGWAGALAPLARERCPVRRITWQHWTHPAGLDGHHRFLDTQPSRHLATAAAQDYRELLAVQAPATVGHEVLVTLTVDQRRINSRHSNATAAFSAAMDEARLLASRLEAAGMSVMGLLSAGSIATAVRARSDPGRRAHVEGLRRSLAAATGKVSMEWGPLALRPEWSRVWVDGSIHRSLVVVGWPMLPVPADWMSPLLSLADATSTVTVVLEPVPLREAAAAANRELTALEADQGQKQRHGFRLTARERRRQHDVESREQELAAGHPEFRHAAFVTVTASDTEELDDVSARVEQAAAQSLLDLRLLAARQAEGWVCSLPLGRNVRAGLWS